jgi:hypothetical protein
LATTKFTVGEFAGSKDNDAERDQVLRRMLKMPPLTGCSAKTVENRAGYLKIPAPN